MLSDNLEKTIKRAISYANDRQQEYVTLEHLLLALIAFLAALFESVGYYALMPVIDIMLGQASGHNQLSEKFISIIKLIGFNENILIGIALFIIVSIGKYIIII